MSNTYRTAKVYVSSQQYGTRTYCIVAFYVVFILCTIVFFLTLKLIFYLIMLHGTRKYFTQ